MKKKLTPPTKMGFNPVKMVLTFNNGDTTLHNLTVYNPEGQRIINSERIERGGIANDIDVDLMPILEKACEETTPGKIIIEVTNISRDQVHEDDSDPAKFEFDITEFQAMGTNLRLLVRRLEGEYGDIKNFPDAIATAVKDISTGMGAISTQLEGLKNPDGATSSDIRVLQEAISTLGTYLDGKLGDNKKHLDGLMDEIKVILLRMEQTTVAAARQVAVLGSVPGNAPANTQVVQRSSTFPTLAVCFALLLAAAGPLIAIRLLVAHGMDLGYWKPCVQTVPQTECPAKIATPVCIPTPVCVPITCTPTNCAAPEPSESCPHHVAEAVPEKCEAAKANEIWEECPRTGCLPPENPKEGVTKVTWTDWITPGETAKYVPLKRDDGKQWVVRAYYDKKLIRYARTGASEKSIRSDGALTAAGFTATLRPSVNEKAMILFVLDLQEK